MFEQQYEARVLKSHIIKKQPIQLKNWFTCEASAFSILSSEEIIESEICFSSRAICSFFLLTSSFNFLISTLSTQEYKLNFLGILREVANINDKESGRHTWTYSFFGFLAASSDSRFKALKWSATSPNKIFCCSLRRSIWSIVFMLVCHQIKKYEPL